jgi:hypothetical protein
MPRYSSSSEDLGCLKLEHLEANNLQSIIWGGPKMPGAR